MWKYYSFRMMGPLLSVLPWRVGYLIAFIVAAAVYALMPGLRSAIADNMRHVLGWDADDRTLRRSVRHVVRNAAKNYFDLVKMPRLTLADIERKVSVHGRAHLEEALGRGKGVILVTPHLGSFDLSVQVLAALSVKTTFLVEAQEPEELLDHVTALRESNGLSFVAARPGAMRAVYRALRRGETVGLACDRDVAKDGRTFVFFGEEVSMPTQAVRLAMRTGAAVVPAYNLRRADNGYDVFFGPALAVATGDDEALRENMGQVIGALERSIRTCPEQWVVLSPLWEDGYLWRHETKGQCPVPS
jgi:KDO2-lipid IV(A) lauroyltransferase